MFELEINVTQDDIDRGIESDCQSCPIARAMERSYIEKFETDSLNVVSASPSLLYIYRIGLPGVESVPTLDARIFMSRFDSVGGKSIAIPFSFRAQFK